MYGLTLTLTLTVDGLVFVRPVLEALPGALVEGAVPAGPASPGGRHGGRLAPGAGGQAGRDVQREVGRLEHRLWRVEVVLFRLDGS